MRSDKYIKPVNNALFLTGIFFYIWLIVNPALIFHGGGVIRGFPVFFFSRDFFINNMLLPGDIAYYLSAFLSQFFFISWIGALVLTVTIAAYTFVLDGLLRKLDAGDLRWIRFTPGFIFLVLYSAYSHPFSSIISLLIALGAIRTFLSFSFDSESTTVIYFFLSSVVIYWIAGGAMLVFAVSVLLYAGLVKKRYFFMVVGLAVAVATPYFLGTYLSEINPSDAYSIATPLYWKERLYHPWGLHWMLLLFLMVPGLVLFSFFIMHPVNIKAAVRRRTTPYIEKINPAKWISMVLCLVLLAAAGYLINTRYFDFSKKKWLLIDYFAFHKKWEAVLENTSGSVPTSYLNAVIDRALYHTFKLGNIMPLWQNPGDILLLTDEHTNAYWYKFDLYLDLGFINMAEHNLNESMEFYGEQPMILQRLALIHCIKGNMGTAKIYLMNLSKTIIYHTWAESILDSMKNDPLLAKNKEISYYRGIKLEKNYPFPFTAYRIFKDLLEKNSKNRMAFEYLMALALLNKDFETLSRSFFYLKNFNYPVTPKLYQEAYVLISSNPENKYSLPEIKINSETIGLYRQFFQTITKHRDNIQAAINDLKKNYSNNYFFYCLTH